jgi:hypothetical protein
MATETGSTRAMEAKKAFGYYNEDGELEFVALQEHTTWADREFLTWVLEHKDETVEMEDLYKRGWSRALVSIQPVSSYQAQWDFRGKQD